MKFLSHLGRGCHREQIMCINCQREKKGEIWCSDSFARRAYVCSLEIPCDLHILFLCPFMLYYITSLTLRSSFFYIPAACILFNGLCSDSTLKVHYFAFRRVTSRTGLFSRIYVYVGLEWTRTTRVRFASWDFEKRTLKREVESWSIFPCVKRQAIILPEQVSEWWLSKSSGKCKLIMFRL